MNIREGALLLGVAAVGTPWLPGHPVLWFPVWILGMVVAAVPARIFRKVQGRTYTNHLLWFSCWMLLCGLHAFQAPSDVRRLLPEKPQSAWVRLQIVGDRRWVTRSNGRMEQRQPARLLSLYRDGGWKKAGGRVEVRWSDEEVEAAGIGTQLELKGVLSPGNFSYTGLKRADWKFVLRPEELEQAKQGAKASSFRWLFGLREKIAARFQNVAPDRVAETSVLSALLLGMRTEMDDSQMNEFAASGLIHIFAVSGLHLGLLSGVMKLIGRRLGWGMRSQVFWLVPLLFLFTWMTGMRASAVRALVMITVFAAAPLFYRKSNALHALSFAVILILVIAPEQVLDPGFQFSILLVTGLLTLWPPLDQWVCRLTAPDPWAPVTGFRTRLEKWVLHSMLRAGTVSVVCVLVSSPLTAYYFSMFSPVGILGNLLAVPLVFLLLLSGFLVMPFLVFPEPVSGFLLQIPLLVANGLLHWVEFLNGMPWGVHWVRPPPMAVLLLAGGCMAAWMKGGRLRSAACALGWMMAGGLLTEAWLHHREVELVLLDVERGQSGWVRNGNGEVLLIDTGSAWSSQRVVDSLKREGIDHLAGVFLTHPDRYHTEGLSQIMKHWDPKHIWVSELDQHHALFEEWSHRITPLQSGDRLTAGGWTIDIMHPAVEESSRRQDDRSLVLRFVSQQASVLWMGGAGEEVEQHILENHQVYPARVVVAGHNRSSPGMSAPFLQQITPELVLTSGEGFEGILPTRIETERRVRSFGVALESPEPLGQKRVRLDTGGLAP